MIYTPCFLKYKTIFYDPLQTCSLEIVSNKRLCAIKLIIFICTCGCYIFNVIFNDMVIAADPAKTNIKTRIFIKLLSFCTIFVIKSFETKGVKLLREYEKTPGYKSVFEFRTKLKASMRTQYANLYSTLWLLTR